MCVGGRKGPERWTRFEGKTFWEVSDAFWLRNQLCTRHHISSFRWFWLRKLVIRDQVLKATPPPSFTLRLHIPLDTLLSAPAPPSTDFPAAHSRFLHRRHHLPVRRRPPFSVARPINNSKGEQRRLSSTRNPHVVLAPSSVRRTPAEHDARRLAAAARGRDQAQGRGAAQGQWYASLRCSWLVFFASRAGVAGLFRQVWFRHGLAAWGCPPTAPCELGTNKGLC